MKNNFFRKDLKLSNRWWHRLFLVVFPCLLAWALYITFDDLSSTSSHPNVRQYKVGSSVEERITTEVKQLRELKKPNEIIEGSSPYYGDSQPDDASIYDDIYCSSDLKNRIDEIQSKSGIDTLYIRNIYNRDNVPIETFTSHIEDNNIKCLNPDSYTSPNNAVEFLEPIGPDSPYNDLFFHKKSDLFNVLYALKMFLSVIVVFIGIAVVYYKIILYIIFGSKKT